MNHDASSRPGPPAAEGGPGVLIVFPPDTRTQVNPTTVFPQQCVGQLTMQFPNGKTYTGTGTLLDDFHVLTCAHNLFSPGDGGLATSVTFVPARNGAAAPYGTFRARTLNVPEEYVTASPASPWTGIVTDDTEYLYDFGLVTLTSAVSGMQNYPGLAWVNDAGVTGNTWWITGYPGDKPAGTMWTASGPVTTEDTEQFLFYTISTYPGQSGSAVMATIPPYPVPSIIGIHVAGDSTLNTNFAVRLNADVIAVINSWM